MRAPTGEQFEITLTDGDTTSRAVIVQVGSGLRHYSVGGADVAEPYAEDVTPPSSCGLVLVPWPNRVKNGKWTFEGAEQQLDITEPARNNAIHGLLRHVAYTLAERTDSSVTLAATVYPQPGYPFLLDTTVTWALEPDGLRVTHTITNAGAKAAPAAIGIHPFVKVGGVQTDDLTLTLSAASHFELDDRLNPIGQHAVDGTEHDFRAGRLVADIDLDDAYGDLTFVDGEAVQTLTAPDGREVDVWGDSEFGFLQVYTTPHLPTPTASGMAIAIEPMTAPAEAFNTGLGLHWVQPGETWTASWGIRHRGF